MAARAVVMTGVLLLSGLGGSFGWAGSEAGGGAERLVVSWAAGAFRLRRSAAVPKRIARSEALPPPAAGVQRSAETVAGFWYELRSCEGTVLYRRAIPDPRVAVVEWLEPGPDGSARIARAEAPRRDAVFTVTVPRHPEGCEVVLTGPPERTARARGAVRELARLRLRAAPAAPGGAP